MKRIIRRTLALAIALMLAMPFTVGLADEGLPCVDVEADASAVEAAGADLDGVDAEAGAIPPFGRGGRSGRGRDRGGRDHDRGGNAGRLRGIGGGGSGQRTV